MSLHQNKLITVTGAKAEIQKFISSTICIVSLCSTTVCFCLCVFWHTASFAAGTQTHSYLQLCHVFFSSCVVKMPPPPSPPPRSAEGLSSSCSKRSSLRSTRLTIIATKAWPAGRGALIELKLSFWIDHCVNFGINTVGSSQGALLLRRAKIGNLSHGSFFF